MPVKARTPSFLVLALSLLSLDVACAQLGPPLEATFPTLPAAAPAGTGAMQPCLDEVEGQVRCGRYRVYEDREARTGRTIDLAFVVADALEPTRPHPDAVTFFFGGPGASATSQAPAVTSGLREIRRERDLLFLDFRGVGHSGALDCHVPFPRGVESRFGEIFPLDHVVACRDALRERARLDLYTSAHNMDDLDELRRWLNYGSLDLVGGSYGTREAQIFLRRHPEAVRTVILNGVVPMTESGYVSDARSLQDSLDEVLAACRAGDACTAAYPDLRATMETVFQRVRRDLPAVTVNGKTVRLGPGELGYALRGLLYGRATEVPRFLARAADGDWQPIADYYVQRSGWASEEGGIAGMHFSVICAEDIVLVDDGLIERETAGTFLGDYLIGGYKRACDVWPHDELDPSFWEPVTSDVPTLLLSGSQDPVTPPSGGDAVAKHLSNSLHVVVPGGGHGVRGPCIADIQARFVDAGSVEGLDTSCVEETPPPEFVIGD